MKTNSKEAKDSGGVGELSLVSRESGSLVGRELDAAIAETVMGFEEVERVGGMFYYHNIELDRTSETGGRWRSRVPLYSTDIVAAMQVEDRIAELGLSEDYALELARTTPAWESSTDVQIYWQVAHATAEQRCRAALQAVALKTPEARNGDSGPTQDGQAS